MTAMHLALLTRFTPSEPDLDPVIGDLEELWATQGPRAPVSAEEWPVDKAARICPVFRAISGRAPR